MKMALRAGAAPHDPAPASEVRFSSLAMGVLIEHVGRRRDCCVLDLGPGFGANVDFLSQFSSRIFIEDLHQTLASIGRPYSGADRIYCPLYPVLLPYHEQAQFDLVLLWNLLDYLDRDDIRRLVSHLAGLSRRGTLLYGLVSTRQKIPDTPASYKIADPGNLICLPTALAQRDGPRHSQVRLLELMRGFRVKRSFLLRNGMQEYLFERT